MADQDDSGKPKVTSLAIKDLTVLYNAYMPFVENGGLFIPTRKVFNIGDPLSLLISLVGEEKKYSIDGKIVWITPDKARGDMPSGVGVQFSGPQAVELCNKIEQLLTTISATNNNAKTNTM